MLLALLPLLLRHHELPPACAQQRGESGGNLEQAYVRPPHAAAARLFASAIVCVRRRTRCWSRWRSPAREETYACEEPCPLLRHALAWPADVAGCQVMSAAEASRCNTCQYPCARPDRRCLPSLWALLPQLLCSPVCAKARASFSVDDRPLGATLTKACLWIGSRCSCTRMHVTCERLAEHRTT